MHMLRWALVKLRYQKEIMSSAAVAPSLLMEIYGSAMPTTPPNRALIEDVCIHFDKRMSFIEANHIKPLILT